MKTKKEINSYGYLLVYIIPQAGEKNNALSRRTFSEIGANEVEGDDGIPGHKLEYYGEGKQGSIASNSIETFKQSAIQNGGFYIGRYEQGQGNICKAKVNPDTNVSRNDAVKKANDMYNNSYVKSELMSSYAWDTALNYICQNNEEGYILATTNDDTYGNIGTGVPKLTGEYTTDKYNNIYDILGNYQEWTTEYAYSQYGDNFYTEVERGASFYNDDNASTRAYHEDGSIFSYVGFRTQLYIKNLSKTMTK